MGGEPLLVLILLLPDNPIALALVESLPMELHQHLAITARERGYCPPDWASNADLGRVPVGVRGKDKDGGEDGPVAVVFVEARPYAPFLWRVREHWREGWTQ